MEIHRGKFVMSESQIWCSDPEILGGTPVFVGTRVPVRSHSTISKEENPSMTFFINFLP